LKPTVWTVALAAGLMTACDASLLGPSDAIGPGPSGAVGSSEPDPIGSSDPDVPSVPDPASDPDLPSLENEWPPQLVRLTRAEYVATVEAAFDTTIDGSGLPVDGRVDFYTSNARTFPDPVFPYLVTAESIAAQIIPETLPACSASDADPCFEANYRPAMEILFRTSEPPMEDLRKVAAAAEASGLTSEEASRAALVAALLRPDFLFRGTPSRAEGDLLQWLSYAVLDAPTSVDGSGLALSSAVDSMLQDPRALWTFSRFLSQWLGVDIDSRRFADADYETTPDYLELKATVKAALVENMPVRDLVRTDRAFVHEQNADRYGLSMVDGGPVFEAEWSSGSARRGLFAYELFASATRHPDPSRRVIFRGLKIRNNLLCDPVALPPGELISQQGDSADRMANPSCAGCHQRMDPIGAALGVLDGDDPQPAQILLHRELEGTYASLPELMDAVAESRSFAECFARNWLSFFLEVPKSRISSSSGWVARIAETVQNGGGFADVAAETVALASAFAGEPVCRETNP
jgi:hypothetical protein